MPSSLWDGWAWQVLSYPQQPGYYRGGQNHPSGTSALWTKPRKRTPTQNWRKKVGSHVRQMWIICFELLNNRSIHQSHLVVRKGTASELLSTHLTRNLILLQHMPRLTVNDAQSFPTARGNCPRATAQIWHKIKTTQKLKIHEYLHCCCHTILWFGSSHRSPVGVQMHRPKAEFRNLPDCPVDCGTAGHGWAADSPAPTTAGKTDAH